MGRYTDDGGVIPSGMPLGTRDPEEHFKMFGLFRGTIIRSIYPDEPQNSNGERMEYVVKVNGQEYPNAVNMRVGGGVYNYNERIRKESEKSFSGKLDSSTYAQNLDGETVYVLFLSGHGNVPVIIGGENHPRQVNRIKKSDGRFDVMEFNGIEFLVDQNSNYTIKHVGRKAPNGLALNPEAIDSQIKMSGNGDIEMTVEGQDLTIKLTKAAKKIEALAQGNQVLMDASGIIVKDKNANKITQNSAGTKVEDDNGNIIEMKGGQVHVTVNGDCKVDASGKVQVTAGGDATVDAANIKLNGASGNVLTTVTDPIVDTIYGVPTIGVPTVKSG